MKPNKKVLLFYICTLGIGYLYAKAKAKKMSNSKNDEIITSNKVDISIDELIQSLGGITNIVSVDATISNLKVKLNNIELADLANIKKMGAKGTLKNVDQLTILFGDNSQAIASELKEKLI